MLLCPMIGQICCPCFFSSICTYKMGCWNEFGANPKLLKSFVYVITDKKIHKWADATPTASCGHNAIGLLFNPRSGAIDLTDITGIREGYPDGRDMMTVCFDGSRARYVTIGCVNPSELEHASFSIFPVTPRVFSSRMLTQVPLLRPHFARCVASLAYQAATRSPPMVEAAKMGPRPAKLSGWWTTRRRW